MKQHEYNKFGLEAKALVAAITDNNTIELATAIRQYLAQLSAIGSAYYFTAVDVMYFIGTTTLQQKALTHLATDDAVSQLTGRINRFLSGQFFKEHSGVFRTEEPIANQTVVTNNKKSYGYRIAGVPPVIVVTPQPIAAESIPKGVIVQRDNMIDNLLLAVESLSDEHLYLVEQAVSEQQNKRYRLLKKKFDNFKS